MAEFIPSKVNIDSEILQLLEAIAHKQGEFSSYQRSIHTDLQIENIATIDAVHFSTRIEGNMLSRDQVTKVLNEKKKLRGVKRDLKEVLNYSRARKILKEWVLKQKKMSEELLLKLHSELLKGIVRERLCGHYREARVAIRDSKTQQIVYLPPRWQDVQSPMKGLISWLRKQQVIKANAPLVAAQFHFEFVTLHPFMDGNGRLARLLTNGILLAGGYDVERVAALEKQHEKDRVAYYRALHRLQGGNYYDIPPEQDISSWIIYWLKCLLLTYEEGLGRIRNLVVGNNVAAPFLLDQRLQRAASLFQRHIKLRASQYADLVGLARTQAVDDLNKLLKAGVLERVGGGRSTVYQVRKK